LMADTFIKTSFDEIKDFFFTSWTTRYLILNPIAFLNCKNL
jgi:hypothetical protein